jgi:hypothetical protein
MTAAGLKCGVPPTFEHKLTHNRPAPRGHQHTAPLAILDDVAGLATSKKAANFGFLLYCWITFSVGYKLSQKPMKTVPPTSHEMLFIGFMLSLSSMTAYLEPERIAKMIATMDDIIQRGELTLNELQKLLGVLVFCCTILGMRSYYQPFIELIKAFSKTNKRTLKLTPDFLRAVKKWHTLVHLFNNRSVITGVRHIRCKYQAFADASFEGWGWAWAGRTEVGTWPKTYHSRFGQMSKLALKLMATAIVDPLHAERIWIAFCESAAALFCLRRILPYCEPYSTLIFNEDNQNVVSWLVKLRCSSEMSKPIFEEIAWLLGCFSIELDVRYINTHDNKTADGASRWAALSQTQRRQCIAEYMHDQPSDWREAGITWHHALRPELLQVMDVWTTNDTGGDHSWYPCPITR